MRGGRSEAWGARQDKSNLRVLADYAINRHYPELIDAPRKYLELLRAVTDRQALLIARWQLVGFIHGVMNTDNMAISGETIDYGPCGCPVPPLSLRCGACARFTDGRKRDLR